MMINRFCLILAGVCLAVVPVAAAGADPAPSPPPLSPAAGERGKNAALSPAVGERGKDAPLSPATARGKDAPLSPRGGREVGGEGVDFFEKKIRPVLVEHCYQCHSAEAEAKKKLRGGLRVDSREGLLKGGDSGPAIVPGKPEESLLIQALRYADGLQMPPRGKLPAAIVADFETWVRQGAPDPRVAAAAGTGKQVGLSIEEGRKFWAYRLPQKPPLPEVRDTSWPWTDIDRFLLTRLETRGLRPVADADRATLARRLYFDLIGLPPSPEEIDAFVNDPSPDAYERLVDRLLASPHFGERWGRHWLDVARFAESVTLRGFVLKEAWRYRDYVIESFNQDVPFDRFIREQVAGDLLPADTPAQRRRQLTALTFLTLGNTNLEEQDKKQLRMDVVDEQLETIGKAFLAQTIGCARCHDHKFDPIPTRDYYALAGILRNARTLEHANVSKWLERPLPLEPEQEAALQKHEQAVAALQARIRAARGTTLAVKPQAAAKSVLAVTDVPGIVVDDAQAIKVGAWRESQAVKPYIGAGYVHDQNEGKGKKTLTFHPELPAPGKYEVLLAYSPGTNRAAAVPVTILSAEGEHMVRVNMQPPPPIDGRFISLGQYLFERNNQGYVIISNEGTTGHVTADAVVFLPAEKAVNGSGLANGAKPADKMDPEQIKRLEAELKRLQANGPTRPMVMTVFEEKEIEDTHVHIRGSVHTLGEKVPRGFLQVATYGTPPAIPAGESGRRQLGEWIASPQNPLTARVIVNRAWHWLFGAGLVRTTDNFGTTGEPPSHPELLDYLAVRFMEEGWSIKKLVRGLVLSRAYRLSSTADRENLTADPENRLLGRMNRRRLEAECIRDAMLAVSGQLDLTPGGPTFPASLTSDFNYKPTDIRRRSVYVPVFRNALPDLFEVFDFADPSMVTGRRNVTTVTPQALFLLNHPFVLEQARHAADRLLAERELDDEGRITRAYRLALGRPPTEAERRIAREFLVASLTLPSPPAAGGEGRVRGAGDARQAWAILVQALFASVDFRYVD
ncbi:MAG TPA: DUF1553 domain-containing protein [Gemmataceae bacterium]|nr:DUF1553 domain-containing protein [Gemmataceae bacterium]